MSRVGRRIGLSMLALALTAAGALFSSPISSAASRGPLPPDQAAGLSASAGIAPKTAGPAIAAVVIGGVGSCYGQTDQPHPSSHVNGTVNTVSRTVCPSTDYVDLYQYRSRWYGWQSWGHGSNTAFGTASANAAGNCGSGDTYTYLGSAYHEAAGFGYAYTSNSRRFTCP
jgi:hypothetical protein